MELTAFAERLVLGTSLQDKLRAPDGLTDDQPGPAWPTSPMQPGRPDRLRFAVGPSPVPDRRLGSDQDRIAALHAFANHELLAIEVMALALLRFPEAPAAFRWEVLDTLRDEQRHLRLYLDRLTALGVAFGDLPVNGRFWRVLSDMALPIDLVARMSLTFEQANLDFAGFFRDRFREAGDVASAAVLARVYADEIGHVRHGVRWLDAWRAPEVDRFDAWVGRLPDDLSPARARGVGFDRQARRRAGLDAAWCDRLVAWGWSHGRPAARWTVDLGAEASAAGTSLTAAATTVASDLAPLAAFLADHGDTVALSRTPTPAFWASWVSRGAPRALLVAADVASHAAASRGWVEPGTPRRWLDKRTAATLRAELADAWPTHALPADLHAVLARDRDTAWAAVRRVHGVGQTCVLKAPFGSAALGQRRIEPDAPPTDRVVAWVEEVLQQQGALLVEPWLDRVLDLSVLIDAEDRVHLRRMLCAPGGRYIGHRLGRPFDALDPALRRWLHERASEPSPVDTLRGAAHHVRLRARADGLHGSFGIDAMVVRWEGAWRLQPLVEVNGRHTMGHVALALERHVAPTSHAIWIHRPARWRPAPNEPVVHEGRLVAGAWPTTDPARCSRVGTWLLAGRDPAELSALERGAARDA